MSSFNPRLSVITVVYNNVADIERTVRSVLNQTWPNIEYIVIDGGSTDGTLDILHGFEGRISVLISEPDKGIYDAMNKGLRIARGDYVNFMNSGDEFYAPNTVEQVFAMEEDADIYYGETEMLAPDLSSLGRRRHQAPERLRHSSFKYGMAVSHQAIFIRRTLAAYYDTSFALSADIDWILNALKRANKVVNARQYVAKYLTGGMSKKKHRESLVERFRIFNRHYGLAANLFHHLIIAGRLATYYLRYGRTND